jgi:hypothetical protein
MSTEIALPPKFRTIEQWGAGLHWLVGVNKNWRWMLGEYLCKGEERYGEKIWQYIDPHDIGFGSKQQVSNAMWTFRSIGDQYNPEAGLTFDTWRELASLKPAQRDPFITRALRGEKVHRDEIRAAAASKASSNGNNAQPEKTAPTPPRAVSVAAEGFGEAMVGASKVLRRFMAGEPCNALLRDAGDELVAAWLKLAELLKENG